MGAPRLSFLVLSLLCSQTLYPSHTFFTPRQVTTDPVFELALTDYNIYHECGDWVGEGYENYDALPASYYTFDEYGGPEHLFQLYIKPFFQSSAQAEKSATYFLPHCKSCVSVREDGTGDIDPIWFNIVAPRGTFYSSTFCLRPERLTYGGVVTFYADLCKITPGLWLLINTAAMGATHSLRAEETNRNSSGTISGFADMCEALNNCALCAGKINCCKKLTVGGLDDIQLKLGYNFYRNEKSHFAAYAVGTIPTGKRPTSEFLFEPLVGSKHGSLGAGLNADWVVVNRGRYQLTLLADLKYRYVFKATEQRSFDLCPNGDWSRYLLVAAPGTPLCSQSGICFFTMPAEVTPRNTIDFWLAGNQRIHDWNLELGYNLWWRQKEKITLPCCNTPLDDTALGIFDMAGVCHAPGTSASGATINQSIANHSVISNSTFVRLTNSNLDLDSAAHPNVITNKLYLASAYNFTRSHYSSSVGLGASYEVAWKNNALNQWALWAIVDFNF